MPGLRTSQRAPTRCTECASRRVRCSKTIPCDSCIKNNIAHRCEREVVSIRGRPVVAQGPSQGLISNADLIRENCALRERIARLQAKLATNSSSDLNPPDPEFDQFNTILEEWNIGGLDDASEGIEVDLGAFYLNPSSIHEILPMKQDGEEIVRFSLQNLGWIHCALDGEMFVLEDGDNSHSKLSIYLSILTVGLFFMSESDILERLSPSFHETSRIPKLCRLWYRAALCQLELSDHIGRPSLHTVQVAAILSLCHRHMGERQRDYIQTGTAINVARSLKMHLLGSETSCRQSISRIPLWSTQSNRDLGRRLWWTLVICDWLGSTRFPSSITPTSFDCELPKGTWGFDHHSAIAQVAAVVNSYTGKNDTSFETLYEVLLKLDELEEVPLLDDSLGQRCHYSLALNQVRLKLCRALFRPGAEKMEAHEDMHRRALTAAAAIPNIPDFPSVYKMTWLFASAMVAAGVFLVLDLMTPQRPQSEVDVYQQRSQIRACIAALLPLVDKTTICRKGVKTLQQLLEVEQTGSLGQNVVQLVIEMQYGRGLAVQNFGYYESADLNTVMFDDWLYFDDDFCLQDDLSQSMWNLSSQ